MSAPKIRLFHAVFLTGSYEGGTMRPLGFPFIVQAHCPEDVQSCMEARLMASDEAITVAIIGDAEVPRKTGFVFREINERLPDAEPQEGLPLDTLLAMVCAPLLWGSFIALWAWVFTCA